MNIDDAITWHHDPTPTKPFRIRPSSEDLALSYRRILTLQEWCDEQFGPKRVSIDHRYMVFQSEREMTLFVTLWSGIEVAKISIDRIKI
jgi:hypothetical protein